MTEDVRGEAAPSLLGVYVLSNLLGEPLIFSTSCCKIMYSVALRTIV